MHGFDSESIPEETHEATFVDSFARQKKASLFFTLLIPANQIVSSHRSGTFITSSMSLSNQNFPSTPSQCLDAHSEREAQLKRERLNAKKPERSAKIDLIRHELQRENPPNRISYSRTHTDLVRCSKTPKNKDGPLENIGEEGEEAEEAEAERRENSGNNDIRRGPCVYSLRMRTSLQVQLTVKIHSFKIYKSIKIILPKTA